MPHLAVVTADGVSRRAFHPARLLIRQPVALVRDERVRLGDPDGAAPAGGKASGLPGCASFRRCAGSCIVCVSHPERVMRQRARLVAGHRALLGVAR
jgi:hypothetical protein